MGTHLHVSTKELRHISRAVGRLRREFEHSTDTVDSFHDYLGSGTVCDALDDFAGDWKKKRAKLCGGLEYLGKVAGKAAEAYDGLDQHLAQALLKAEKTSQEKSAKKSAATSTSQGGGGE